MLMVLEVCSLVYAHRTESIWSPLCLSVRMSVCLTTSCPGQNSETTCFWSYCPSFILKLNFVWDITLKLQSVGTINFVCRSHLVGVQIMRTVTLPCLNWEFLPFVDFLTFCLRHNSQLQEVSTRNCVS